MKTKICIVVFAFLISSSVVLSVDFSEFIASGDFSFDRSDETVNDSTIIPDSPRMLPAGDQMISADPVSPRDARQILNHCSRLGMDGLKVDREAVEITPEIQELARGLRYSPQLLYEFVRNTIDYFPMYGSVKGATMTLLDGEANDFDQCSLLIGLLRASGYSTAGYIYGTIRLTGTQITAWLGVDDDPTFVQNILAKGGIPSTVVSSGGSIDYVDMDHVWVKVNIDGTDYVFDPSFKSYASIPGIDLASAMGYDKSAFIASAETGMITDPNYIENMNRGNIRSDLTTYSSNLVLYIAANKPSADLSEIIGGKSIIEVVGEPYLTVLPYETSRVEEFQDIPGTYETLVRIQHEGIDVIFSTPQFYGKRLCIVYSYSGGNYTPILALDGYVVATGNPIPYNRYACYITVDHPYAADGGGYADDYNAVYPVAGYMYYLSSGWGNTGRKIIEKHRRTLAQYRAEGLSESSEGVLCESLAMIGLSWMAETSRAAGIGDRVSGTYTINHHAFGVVGQQDAPFMDMPMGFASVVSTTYEDAIGRHYARSGTNSAFEGGAIDQMQPMSAVSTIRLLDNSTNLGRKIFDADTSNYYTDVRPNLVNYSASHLATIDNYIANNYRLILPEYDGVQDGHYQGIGFIALSPGGGMGNVILGYLSGGYGNDFGMCDSEASLDEQKNHDYPEDNPQTREPVDLLTGHYIDRKMDISAGRGELPFNLRFIRSYNSGSLHTDGPLGLGWSHNLDIRAIIASDGFRGMGSLSPSDAAPAVVAQFVSTDMLRDGLLLDQLMIGTLIHRWFMDGLVENVVTITSPGGPLQFVKMPDDTYLPPPKTWAELTREPDTSFLCKLKNGTELDFAGDGKILTWSDPNGNTVTFSYTGDKITSVSNGLGKSLTIAYNAEDRIASVTDNSGRYVAYSYDTDGNLVSMTDPESEIMSYSYDEPGLLAQLYLPSDPATAFVTNTYDAFDRVITQTDFTGHATYYYYAAGRRTEEINPAGFSRIYDYNVMGSPTRFTDPAGFETQFDYDGLNRLIRVTRPEGDGMEYVFDEFGDPVQLTRFPKSGSTETPLVATFLYDPVFHKLTRRTDPMNRITDYSYDANGNLQQIECPEVDGSRVTITYSVESHGLLTGISAPEGFQASMTIDPVTAEMTSISIDPGSLNLTAIFDYDSVGNVVSMTMPSGDTYTYAWDNCRRLTHVFAPAPFDYESRFGYDPDGILTDFLQETGVPTDPWREFSATANVWGDLTSGTDPVGNVRLFDYDNQNRLSQITHAGGQTEQMTYTSRNFSYQSIDPLGNAVETHAYTADGKHQWGEDAGGNRISDEYDDFDRPWKQIFPDGSYREYTWDDASNVTSIRLRTGDVITYQYDAMDRLIRKTLPGPVVTEYHYNGLSQITRITTPEGDTVFGYDSAQRLISITYPDGRAIGYQYDANGNRSRVTYPDGYYVTYQFDALDRMTGIYENGVTELAHFTYDSLSRMIASSYLNGVTTDFTFLPDNNVDEIDYHFTDGDVVFDYLGYDQLGYLTGVTIDSDDFQYRPTRNSGTSYSVNNLNQYVSVEGQPFTYDAEGNLSSDGVNTYGFSPDNRLISVTTPDHTVNMTFNALGFRDSRSVDGLTEEYVWGADQLLAAYDDQGTLTRHFIYGPGIDHPIMMDNAGSRYFYHQDRMNSVVALSDASGNRVESYGYSPHGKPSQISSLGNPFMFNGRDYDAETGLYDHRARYYSPELGRYLSGDPIGMIGSGMNLYRFALNNPVNFNDPSGMASLASDVLNLVGMGLGRLPYLPLYIPARIVVDLVPARWSAKTNAWLRQGNQGSEDIETLLEHWQGWGEEVYSKGEEAAEMCNVTWERFEEYLDKKGFESDTIELVEIGVGFQSRWWNWLWSDNNSPSHFAILVRDKKSKAPIMVLDPIQTGNSGWGFLAGQQGDRRWEERWSAYTYTQWMLRNKWTYGLGSRITDQ